MHVRLFDVDYLTGLAPKMRQEISQSPLYSFCLFSLSSKLSVYCAELLGRLLYRVDYCYYWGWDLHADIWTWMDCGPGTLPSVQGKCEAPIISHGARGGGDYFSRDCSFLLFCAKKTSLF